MPRFSWFDTPWGPALRCDALEPFARHVFTARGLDLPHADAGGGWTQLAAWLDVEPENLWRMRQVHGVTAHTDDVAPCNGSWPEGDLLATDRADIGLAVRTADCVPLLYADTRTGAVAAVHAGWRGTVAGAVPRMVDVLASRFGSRAADLVVAIGPSIGPESYEVGQEVVDAFAAAWPEDVARGTWWTPGSTPGKYQLDLWTVTRDQLAAAGVPPPSIHLAGLCTAVYPAVLQSYRVDGAAAGRMVAAIRQKDGGRKREDRGKG
jgi:polyphenol oxidase